MASISVHYGPHARCSDPAVGSVDARLLDASTSKFPNGKSRDRVRVAHPERGVVWPSDLGTTRRPHRGLLTSRLPFRLQAGEQRNGCRTRYSITARFESGDLAIGTEQNRNS